MPVFQSVLFSMGFVFRSMAPAASCAVEAASHLLLIRCLLHVNLNNISNMRCFLIGFVTCV